MNTKWEGVSETALITLYMRAKDLDSERPILFDFKAKEIAEKIEINDKKLKKAWASYLGCIIRARVMDNEAKKFIQSYSDATIISVGAGLDTRFYRVDNGKIHWYNIDFLPVIQAREKLLGKHARVENIAMSALDPAWPDKVNHKNRKVLIISEGMLMYFSKEEVKEFLKILTDKFDSFTAQFDLLSKNALIFAGKHDVVDQKKAPFKFGCKDGSEITKLNPLIKQIGYTNFTDEMEKHVKGWRKMMMPFIRCVNNRLGIYTYKRKMKE